VDLKEIKRLITIVEEAKISHFSVDVDGMKIEIKKEGNNPNPAQMAMQQPILLPQTIPQPVEELQASPKTNTDTPPKTDVTLIDIKSQMVGTFYASSNPDSAAYVKVGDPVSNGQVICIIEAMKLFNEIECETTGVVEEICVKNGDPVEYGQPLFKLRTS
jgi:acetyl-CoA carboxylase biotin carboxyl carrier protein